MDDLFDVVVAVHDEGFSITDRTGRLAARVLHRLHPGRSGCTATP
jgi:hypothetical protein